MTLYEKAIQAIDAYNQKDPTTETENGVLYPKEYLDSLRYTYWVGQLNPAASEALKLAARSQHIGRWEIQRETYPLNRTGYLQWRSDLSKFHAAKSAELLKSVGYDDSTIARVSELNLKKGIKLDADAQTIEDALCLVFLERHIEAFVQKHQSDHEKLINILQKTWKKMGTKGREYALQLSYSPRVLGLIKEALGI